MRAMMDNEDQVSKLKIIHTVNTGESLVPDGPGAGQHGLNSHAALYPDSEHIDGDQKKVI